MTNAPRRFGPVTKPHYSEVCNMRSKVSVTVKFCKSDTDRQAGFSLMELMSVVVIVGVLSAMAIPTFSDYIYKSRATEATEFLGVIRLREESYRSEFGAYCPTLTTAQLPTTLSSLDTKSNLVPDPSTTRKNSVFWTATDTWRQLGATPSGAVRFGYGVAAGNPSNMPTGLGFETRPDFWWVGRAVGDLDGDGTYVMFETYSANKGIYIGTYPPPSVAIAKGWE
jgi:prepilin-type N-terminal cleavage/methylation domain-containing protein